MKEEIHEVANGVEVSYSAPNNIWDAARQRIQSFEGKLAIDGEECTPVGSDSIKLSLKVVDLLKKYKVKPSRIIPCVDGGVSIDFHRWNKEYDIEIEDSDIIFCEQKKRCFMRRNSEGDVPDGDLSVSEVSLKKLEGKLAEIEEDTFDDFSNLIKGFADFEENWHINYRKSRRVSDDAIWAAVDGLNFLGGKGIKPTGVFPIVMNVEPGDVSIRICFKLKKSYAADFTGDLIEFHVGELFSPWDSSLKMNRQKFEQTIIDMVTGKYTGR